MLKRRPVVLAVPGDGGTETDFADHVGLPNFASRAGLTAYFVSPGDVGSSYYHPRTDGTDFLTFLLDELVPAVERRYDTGGTRTNRAVYGYSMGGYGALLIAQQRREFARAVVAASPAVFPTYKDAIAGHPGTFDSAADWARYGVWTELSSLRVPVRIDCGDADPFASTAKQLLERIPHAVGAISTGCHDVSFWRKAASAEVEFLKEFLA